jgi:aspartate racemase
MSHNPAVNEDALWQRNIGILGGLGPFAHLELERRILAAAEAKIGRALLDQEFPPWFLASIPQTPDRTSAILGRGESPLPCMLQSLRFLEAADFAVIACNTAHAFVPELRARAALPILDMIEETMYRVARDYGPRAAVGLLASSGTLEAGVYQRAAQKVSPQLRLITPLNLRGRLKTGVEIQERMVMGAIFGRRGEDDDLHGGIKSGAHRVPEIFETIRSELTTVVRLLRRHGAQAVILGCTEFPLVMGRGTVEGVPLIDPLDVVARVVVEIAAGDRELPA